MILRFNDFLFEGRYDRLTGSLVDFIWNKIKETRISWEQKKSVKKIQIKSQNQSNGSVTFDLLISIKRKKGGMPEGFLVNGYTDVNYKKLDDIDIEIFIDPDFEPKCYTMMNSVLQDTVRHEIEHLTQEGKNKMNFKAVPTPEKVREEIYQQDAWKYYLLPDEIDAMIHGLYRGAKTEKVPFDVYSTRYLNWRKRSGDNIPDDKYSEIMNTWIERAIKLLPAVQIKQRIY